jgi:nucleoside-diphosphate-sugar epimerase
MKILIIGGTGVLSRTCSLMLLRQGQELFMINRGNHLEEMPKNVTLLKSDIADEQKINSLIKDLSFDVTVDFLCYNEAQLHYHVGLFGEKTKQFIFISSYAVYNTYVANKCDETAATWLEVPDERCWNYGLQKCKCEKLLKELSSTNNFNYTIVRPAVTYDDTRIPYGIIPWQREQRIFIERILQGKPIITWNGGENYCNITHVDDFAVAFAGLVGNPNAYNQTFNINGDEIVRWKDVLTTISEVLTMPVKTVDVPVEYYAQNTFKKDDLLGGRSISASCINNKIKSVVPDFRQTVSLKEGMQRTIAYYMNNKSNTSLNYSFEGETDRVITHYNKLNKSDSAHLHFIDYDKKKNPLDLLRYLKHRYMHP